MITAVGANHLPNSQNTVFRRHGGGQLWLTGQPEYDVLVVDECSTVDNANMLRLLEKVSFKLLVLVGDVCQIESIGSAARIGDSFFTRPGWPVWS